MFDRSAEFTFLAIDLLSSPTRRKLESAAGSFYFNPLIRMSNFQTIRLTEEVGWWWWMRRGSGGGGGG